MKPHNTMVFVMTCCPPVTNRPNFFNKLTMTTVDKECVNAEGDLVVLKKRDV